MHATRRKRRNNPLQKWTDNSDGHNKECLQKTESYINANRNNGTLNDYYIYRFIEINEQCLRKLSINIVELNSNLKDCEI